MVLPASLATIAPTPRLEQIARPRLVAAHGAVQHALAARVGEELGAVAEQSAARRDEVQAHAVAALLHRLHAAAALRELLHHRARRGVGHLDHHVLDRLAALAVDLARDDLGARHR